MEDNEDVGISIETTQDGALKLSCADPQMLQASYIYLIGMCSYHPLLIKKQRILI